MSGMDEEVIDRADVLDSAGNTAKAITKGFAIAAAALTVLGLFAAFRSEIDAALAAVGKPTISDAGLSLMDPKVLAGIFLGSMCPPLFSALTMLSVTKNAFKMIEYIRGVFKKNPKILEDPVMRRFERNRDSVSMFCVKGLGREQTDRQKWSLSSWSFHLGLGIGMGVGSGKIG